MGTMIEKFWCIEVASTRKPCRGNVRTIGKDAKVGNKPHPALSDYQCGCKWDQNAKNRSAPQCDQGSWVWVEKAVRQVPREKIGIFQGAAANPPTNDVSRFMREGHHAP